MIFLQILLVKTFLCYFLLTPLLIVLLIVWQANETFPTLFHHHQQYKLPIAGLLATAVASFSTIIPHHDGLRASIHLQWNDPTIFSFDVRTDVFRTGFGIPMKLVPVSSKVARYTPFKLSSHQLCSRAVNMNRVLTRAVFTDNVNRALEDSLQ